MHKPTITRISPAFHTLFVASLLAVGLNGCASTQPMKLALTEMGTTSDSEYGAYGLRLMRAVNVTGLGPEEVVGTMTTDPDKFSIHEQLAKLSPFRSDLPDSMSPRITSGQSMIVERRFCKLNTQGNQCVGKAIVDACNITPSTTKECENIVTIKDLTELRDSLQSYQANIAEATHQEVKMEVLASAQSALADKNKTVPDKDAILQVLQELYPEDDLKDKDAVNSALNVPKDQVNSPLSAQLEKIKKILSKPGVIVTNWERETALTGGANVADAQGALSTTRKVSGFLILGEPRITSLQLGKDLLGRQQDTTPSDGADSLFNIKRNYITHYQLRAKYVVFAESFQSAFRASLQADIQAIAMKLQPLIGANLVVKLKSIQAKVNASYAAVSAASESGVLDASSGYVQSYPFSFDKNQTEKCIEAEMKRAEDTLPLISIRSTLDDLVKINIKKTQPQTSEANNPI